MVDKIKKVLMVAGVLLVIWAFVDPGAAANFVHFAWGTVQDGLTKLFAFVHNVFT